MTSQKVTIEIPEKVLLAKKGCRILWARNPYVGGCQVVRNGQVIIGTCH